MWSTAWSVDFELYYCYGKFRWGQWIQSLPVTRTALVMLTTMATIHGNGILLSMACFFSTVLFRRAIGTLFCLSPQQGQTCTHTTYTCKKIFLIRRSKFQQSPKRSTHHICGRDKWFPLCHSVLLYTIVHNLSLFFCWSLATLWFLDLPVHQWISYLFTYI
jgi:hypothetical protein